MQLNDAKSCFEEIAAYFNSEASGYPFIANIDDCTVYQSIISKIQADSSKQIIRLSDFSNGDNLPKTYKYNTTIKNMKDGIVLGYVTYAMFQGEEVLKQTIHSLLTLPVSNHVVILLYGCSGILKNAIRTDGNRAVHRTIIIEASDFSYPKITLVKDIGIGSKGNLIQGFSNLLRHLESFAYDVTAPEMLLVSNLTKEVFGHSVIPIETAGGIFDILCRNYPEIKASMEQSWGTEKQWLALGKKLKKHGTLSDIIFHEFGSTSNLSMLIEDGFENLVSEKAWLLWIAMKVFGTKENEYLATVTKKSLSVKNLIELIYMELLEYKHSDENFIKLYKERKRLIEKLNVDLAMVQKYCAHVGQYAEKAIYYLTDISYKEQRAFLYYLGKYQYTESEILEVVKYAFPALNEYLGSFEFDSRNTKNPSDDSELYTMLTKYFHDYRLQKVSNRISNEFMEMVNLNAVERPFMKLLPRISIVKGIDRTKAQIHFFDALGVEFLPYIIERCNYYGLQTLIHIAHCELPSITSMNKEFTKFFILDHDENGEQIIPGTKELDKLKHHSKKIDYTKCKEPVHLFFELKIIDEELRKIRGMLIDSDFDKIIVISDHGASRLSVIHQTECEMLKLEKKGEESGRCCKVPEDPCIPMAIFENGYAVLANYDRFKGSRKANVEVHGGASLEETVVPIIEITLKPESIDIYIVNKVIEFHNKEIVAVIIHSNVTIQSPKLIVRNISNKSTSYECNCTDFIDTSNYRFNISEIKRTGKFTADLYDGDKLIQQNMTFETKKAVGKTNDLFLN